MTMMMMMNKRCQKSRKSHDRLSCGPNQSKDGYFKLYRCSSWVQSQGAYMICVRQCGNWDRRRDNCGDQMRFLTKSVAKDDGFGRPRQYNFSPYYATVMISVNVCNYLHNEHNCQKAMHSFVIYYTRVLISPQPDQEGNKLGSMSGTRAISTTSRREMSSSFFPCKARRRRKFTQPLILPRC